MNPLPSTLLNAIGARAADLIRRRIRQNRITPSKNSGTTLVKSARLVNSIHHQLYADHVVIGTNLVYARIQHMGGIIRPRTARYLAIPLTKLAAVSKPRDFDNTFISKGVIFQKQDGSAPLALYVLKKQVTIPPRPFLFLDSDDLKNLTDIVSSFYYKLFINQLRSINAHKS